MHRLGRFVSTLVLVLGGLFIVWLLAGMFAARPGIDLKGATATVDCRDLARAVEAYRDHPANPEHKLPTRIWDLIHPPWGGPSLYRGEAEEPRDPWGDSYRMEQLRMTDGSPCILVWTETPDGIKISQFGSGPLADPRWWGSAGR